MTKNEIVCVFFFNFSGTGIVEINGKDINYFQYTQPKETVCFCFNHFSNSFDLNFLKKGSNDLHTKKSKET